MAEKNKVCIELSFSKGISFSQRIKVKEFWKYLDEAKPLEPYEITEAERKVVPKEERRPPACKRKWYHQLKILQENGLDKAALAANEDCKLCREHAAHTKVEFQEKIEDSYDELLNDMKSFEDRLNGSKDSKEHVSRKKSSTSRISRHK